MPRTSYPSPADVEGLLRSSSFWPADSVKQDYARLQCQIGADAAADEFEKAVNWLPFLVSSNEATEREFWEIERDGRVDLRGGAVEIQSVMVNGVALQAGLHGYRTCPQNAIARNEPITALEVGYQGYTFNYPASSQPIVVKAVWGYSHYCPSDVWQAIQQRAALIALTQIENLQNVASIVEDGFSKTYDVVGVVTQKDLVTLVWGKGFNAAIRRYAREVSF